MSNPTPHNQEVRLALVEERQERTEKTMESVANALKLLAVIDMKNDSIIKSVTALDVRVASMESDWPILRQIKAGAEWGAKIILCGAFVAILALAGVKISA